ncbi:3'-5' exonuclease [Bradyrhizobium sp. Pear76]|uniref:exonuclease domain-containing protein n=1 Tax=Bradyrhizobium oropedii TaxID=1571201 RepID=UPI001E4F483E|nr:exonuclease domain-containing protein [Bradyrhizobium oropedii]MCC8967896.1 3'-5' exonuclease [Bradyrhizobium oropedii]
MLFRVWDCETTGMPPDAALCEIGYCDVRTNAGELVNIGEPTGMLVNPKRPMPPEARAIHHISDADLANAPPIDKGLIALNHPSVDVFVAHNAGFEQQFFTGAGKPWICTLKVARRLWPECPSHTNQCLRYFLGIELDDALAMPPHRAAPDAYVTAHILVEAIKAGASLADMIEWTAGPSLLPRVTFGKHKGSAWSDLPGDYLSWIVNKSEMDADTKFTARHHLDERRKAYARP